MLIEFHPIYLSKGINSIMFKNLNSLALPTLNATLASTGLQVGVVVQGRSSNDKGPQYTHVKQQVNLAINISFNKFILKLFVKT